MSGETAGGGEIIENLIEFSIMFRDVLDVL